MRQCGTCSACCRWPSIPELNKPAREPCKHLCGGKYGCEIYDSRPPSCSDYECTWLKGFGAAEDQPVYSHVLIDMRNTKQWGKVLVAKPLRFGACRTAKGRIAIQRIAEARGVLCIILNDGDSQTVVGVAGPKKLCEAFRKGKYTEPKLDINSIIKDAMAAHEEYVAGAV